MFLSSSSFTLVELLVVLAVIAVLATVIVVVINPAELLKQFRDASRISDLASINRALNYVLTDCPTCFFGTSSVVYVSIPDSSPTCANLGLPSLPPGWSYACSDENNFRKVDGTGWIPVDFTKFSAGSPLPKLPVDPINSTTTGEYYVYVTGGSWALAAQIESNKYKSKALNDEGTNPAKIEVGTNLNLIAQAEGLVGYWSFDEGSGTTAYDKSGNNNHGTLINNPTWQSEENCIRKSCLLFDSNSYVKVLASEYFNIYEKLTISFFVKPLWSPINEGVEVIYSSLFRIHHRGDWDNDIIRLLYAINEPINSGDSAWYYWAGVKTNENIYQGNTYNLTFVMDGKRLASYINGSLSRNLTDAFGSNTKKTTNNSDIFLGRLGIFDEIRIYNRALSDAEIQAIYNATR